MITELCQECNNYFPVVKTIGTFKIQGGIITPPVELAEGQYFRIIGSLFNDGVHKYGDAQDVLIDEPDFKGAVWSMSVPKAFVQLSDDIDSFQTLHADSPYISESFGGYSYTRGTTKTGACVTWREQFSSRLNMWRRIRP